MPTYNTGNYITPLQNSFWSGFTLDPNYQLSPELAAQIADLDFSNLDLGTPDEMLSGIMPFIDARTGSWVNPLDPMQLEAYYSRPEATYSANWVSGDSANADLNRFRVIETDFFDPTKGADNARTSYDMFKQHGVDTWINELAKVYDIPTVTYADGTFEYGTDKNLLSAIEASRKDHPDWWNGMYTQHGSVLFDIANRLGLSQEQMQRLDPLRGKYQLSDATFADLYKRSKQGYSDQSFDNLWNASALAVGALAGAGGAFSGGAFSPTSGSGLLAGEASSGLLSGSGAIEGAAGVTEGLGAGTGLTASAGSGAVNYAAAAESLGGITGGTLGTTGTLGTVGTTAAGTGAGLGSFVIPGSTVAEAFAAPALTMGSGLLGQSGAIASGIAGTSYVSPFATGSITGAAGMAPITGAGLADIAATTGMSTAGLGAAGGALTGPVADGFKTGINSWQDALNADAAEMAKPQTDWWEKAKDAKRLYDTAKGLMDKGQPQEQGSGLLDAGGVRQFSPLEVSYLPKLQPYGLLNQPQFGLLG